MTDASILKAEHLSARRVALAAVSCLALFTAAGCSRMASSPSFPAFPQAQDTTTVVTAPAPTTTPVARLEQQAADLSISEFIDPAALQSMTEKDKSEAASAQFFALQFGRPGAPRNWTGDTGNSGEVSVGPYIRVNSLDCREFTHTTKVGGVETSRQGTSCREANGDWRIANVS